MADAQLASISKKLMDANVIQSMNLPDEARRSALFADFKWADQDG